MGGSHEMKTVSVIVPMHAEALRIENALRVLCTQKHIILENPYEGRDIRSYVDHSTMLSYTIHVWPGPGRLHFGIDGDASFVFRVEVRGN